MTSGNDPHVPPHDGPDIATAIVIAKDIAHAAETEATAVAAVEAHAATEHIMDKKVER
ncbi:hypothetical protein BDV12DRAFT_160274 [Aspergillus spectabilis]